MGLVERAQPTSALWSRWGELTRSLISPRVAVERERSFWESLNITNTTRAFREFNEHPLQRTNAPKSQWGEPSPVSRNHLPSSEHG